ncbi:hypothetical protein NSP_17620 [Nodularia spumigena CCY9414]|nr:hypothetical protein NSP_17620 [Nodularia spumigena CCY9414]
MLSYKKLQQQICRFRMSADILFIQQPPTPQKKQGRTGAGSKGEFETKCIYSYSPLPPFLFSPLPSYTKKIAP